MKIKEWLKQHGKNGRKGYLAGGAVCLAGAALVLALSLGVGARAEELDLGGAGKLNFDVYRRRTEPDHLSGKNRGTVTGPGKCHRRDARIRPSVWKMT